MAVSRFGGPPSDPQPGTLEASVATWAPWSVDDNLFTPPDTPGDLMRLDDALTPPPEPELAPEPAPEHSRRRVRRRHHAEESTA